MKSCKTIVILFLLFCCSNLSGCKSIFVQNTDKFAQVEVTKDELENDLYYIKDGTRFVKVHKPNILSTTDRKANRNCSVCFLRKDYKTVPTLYKGEIIAIASAKSNVSSINLTRYKAIGYTLGAFGMTFDEDNNLCGTLQNNVFKYSNLFSYLNTNAKSDNIRISSLNGQELADNMLTETGLFVGLERDCSYTFDYYAGTYYSEGIATADVFAMQEFEYYELTNPEDTKNGYIAFSMPEDAKSGWYMIDNQGMFRYIAEKKGINIESVNMNEAYYTSDVTQNDIYSQKFSVTFDVRLIDVNIELPYDSTSIEDESQIAGTLIAPDGTEYDMTVDTENKIIQCMLEEAMAGKWIIYIQPKELKLQNVRVISSENQQEITEEEYPIEISESGTNVNFEINYEGEGKIYAIIVYPDNTTYDFVLDSKLHKLNYTAPYVESGEYNIKIYHYTDTSITKVDKVEDTITDTDIITITE